MTSPPRARTARRLSAAVVAWTLPLLLADPSPAHGQMGPAVARVAAIQGTATVERFGTHQPAPLMLDGALYRADTAHTAASSRVRLLFDGDTVVTLGELASLRITQIAAPGGAESSRLTVLSGIARFRVRPGPARPLTETWTPTAVAAVRGTEYIVEVTAQGTAVLVIDGTLAVSNYRPDVRGPVVLHAGQGTSVPPDRPPGPATRWGDARRRAVEEATRLP